MVLLHQGKELHENIMPRLRGVRNEWAADEQGGGMDFRGGATPGWERLRRSIDSLLGFGQPHLWDCPQLLLG